MSRLSYSGLEAYRRCGYRFFLERTLKLSRVDAPPGGEPAASGLSALLRGTVVHGLLERLDFAQPVVPSDADVAAAIEQHGVEALPADVADVRDMVERLAKSALRERIAGARRVRTELPFAFTLDVDSRSLLINGVVDVHADEGARTLVVDWKSDALERARAGGRSLGSRTPPSGSYTRSPPSRRARSAWRSSTATWSAPTSPPWRSTRPRTRRRSSASCSAWRRESWTAASSPRQSRISRSVRTVPAGRRCACTNRSSHCVFPSGPRPNLADMPLCFIEPQEAIRVVAESVGREARRQLLGEVVRAWVDEIPEDELQVHYAKAVEELDDDDLSMLAAWHASLEVGQPIANKEFLLGAFSHLGDHRREALRIAAGFKGEDAFEAGVSEEQALTTVLPWLSHERLMELAAEAVELYCWDRLGSDN